MKHGLGAKIKIYIYSALILHNGVYLRIRNVADSFCISCQEAISAQHRQHMILLDNTFHFG